VTPFPHSGLESPNRKPAFLIVIGAGVTCTKGGEGYGSFFVSRILFYVNEPGIAGIALMHISYWLMDELSWTSYL